MPSRQESFKFEPQSFPDEAPQPMITSEASFGSLVISITYLWCKNISISLHVMQMDRTNSHAQV